MCKWGWTNNSTRQLMIKTRWHTNTSRYDTTAASGSEVKDISQGHVKPVWFLSVLLGFISSSAQYVQRDQRPSRDYPWPGEVNSKRFTRMLLLNNKADFTAFWVQKCSDSSDQICPFFVCHAGWIWLILCCTISRSAARGNTLILTMKSCPSPMRIGSHCSWARYWYFLI